MMRWAAIRNALIALVLATLPGPQDGGTQSPKYASPILPQLASQVLGDRRPNVERRASVTWRRRLGPERQVVDLVCLVPDLRTFLVAISAWDERHAFPILFDDADLAFKFMMAFRPARVVRLPSVSPPIADDALWSHAVAAVGRACGPRHRQQNASAGDHVPQGSRPGQSPPGIVLSAPGSPLLAGAVALAAGRFQPLLRWEPGRSLHDVLELGEALRLAGQVEALISGRLPLHNRAESATDFLTLAGNWPYRYQTAQGPNAFDDLLGRSPVDYRRRAYVGRLVGTQAAGVYQAMCSLFLQPDSAVLFNTYSEVAPIWSAYEMRSAAARLSPWLDIAHRSGRAEASIAGWHQVFDPLNRSGLVMINSGGLPDRFAVQGSWGQTGDIPPSMPAAVIQIHSHSAADPADPMTLAGRWLAHGAFIYVGAMNEPQLQAFRTPALEALLMTAECPLAAVVRQSDGEPFGIPWRIVYLGDPLYRFTPGRRAARCRSWEPVAPWPALRATAAPPAGSGDAEKLEWSLNQALVQLERSQNPAAASRILPVLFSVRRERLANDRQVLHDHLLAHLLDRPECEREVRNRLGEIPSGSLTPVLQRRLEASRMAELHRALAQGDLVRAGEDWDLLIRSSALRSLKVEITARVTALADRPARLQQWRDQLRATLHRLHSQPDDLIVAEELKRIEQRLGL